MGNQLVGATPGQILSVESYLSELPAHFQTTKFTGLGSTRFFKVARINHEEGSLVVKVLVKPDPTLQLQKYRDKLLEVRDLLVSTSNCLPYYFFHETDRAGILIRQYVRDNLYDRISTRPFLSPTEKLWMLYQLLSALKEAHSNKIYHGDIKTENVMVTSWNWVLMTDFASYKPTYLPEDDPSLFSFFFDTSRRRVCYIAPERFIEMKKAPPSGEEVSSAAAGASVAAGRPADASMGPDQQELTVGSIPKSMYSSTPPTGAKVALNPSDSSVMFVAGRESRTNSESTDEDRPLTMEMDVFSLGCVAAELFCDGTPLFDLAQLLAYRNGAYDPEEKLATIENKHVRRLIRDMICLNPADRLSAAQCLQKYRGVAFPIEFSTFLMVYCRRFCGEPILSADDRIARLHRDMKSIILDRLADTPPGPSTSGVSSPTQEIGSLDRVQPEAVIEGRQFQDVDSTAKSAAKAEGADSRSLARTSSEQKSVARADKYIGGTECLVVIASILTSSIRHCTTFHGKLTGLELMILLAQHCSDEVVLERFVPYMTHLLSDDAPQVQALAIRGLAMCTKVIKNIPKSDTNLFPEYILPALHPLATTDSDLIVRLALAENIVFLAETALRFLELSQLELASEADRSPPTSSNPVTSSNPFQFQGSFDTELLVLHDLIQKQVVQLLCDPINTVKRTLLGSGISRLCIFFGRQKANDVLLSHMITFQNDKHDWQLRGGFFDSIVNVAAYVGAQSLNMVMPLLQQGLGDSEETVVYKAIDALTKLCSLGLFHKVPLQMLSMDVLPILLHPNATLRYAAVGFVRAMARALDLPDLHCLLLTNLLNFLRKPIYKVTDQYVLIAMLNSHLRRGIYDNLVRCSDLNEFFAWLREKHGSRTHLTYSPMKTSTSLQTLLNKIHPLSDTDNKRIWALKEYIVRMQRSRTGVPEPVDETDGLNEHSHGGAVLRGPMGKCMALTTAPSADFAFPLSSATLQPARSASGKKTAVPDGPAMSEEWNQMFGSTMRTSTANRGKDQSTLERGSIQRRSEGKKSSVRQRTESTAAGSKSGVTRSPRKTTMQAQGRSTSSADVLGASTPAPAVSVGSKKFRSYVSEDQPDSAARVAASTESASASNSTVTTPAHVKQSFVIPEPFKETATRAMCEDRPRVCRQDLHKMTLHRHEQYVRGSSWAEELAAVRTSEASATSTRGWVPTGKLVAHMQEHHSSINQIVVAEDDSLFATCSDDSTVRVWDCNRLQGRNVLPHRSLTSYNKQDGRILSVLFLKPTQLASCATDGSVHIFNLAVEQRVSVTRQASPPSVLNKGDHFINLHKMAGGNVLIGASMHSRIVAFDLREPKVAWSLQNPLKHGLVTCSALDRLGSWLAVGTVDGTHVCWDLRFHRPVSTWSHPGQLPIQDMAPHPVEHSRLISSANANNEVTVWNMESGSRQQVFWGGNSGNPLAPSRTSNHCVRALCTHHCLGGDGILLGGSDKRVRLFNMAAPLESSLLCTAASDKQGPDQPIGKYRKLQVDGVSVLQEQIYVKTERARNAEELACRGPEVPPPGHLDAITGLAITNAGQNYLLSTSRDGVVKVWK